MDKNINKTKVASFLLAHPVYKFTVSIYVSRDN